MRRYRTPKTPLLYCSCKPFSLLDRGYAPTHS
jgi:hypothetical protein